MPAIYPIDLIEKRDKKRRMDRGIVKSWNAHYQTLEEVEAQARKGEQEPGEAEAEELQAIEAEAPQVPGETEPKSADAYNAKTGSYSGNYGQHPVEDEAEKEQITAILREKKDAFDSALSALQQSAGQE